MSAEQDQGGDAPTQTGPSEEDRSEIDQRAAYEAELNRITSSEMILQTAVSLLNIGGRRLGLGSAAGPPAAAERDLEQVRDAIDGASALLPILERRMPRELGPLRDAVAQLQVAYAREAQGAGNPASSAPQAPGGQAKPAKDRAADTHTKPAEADEPVPPSPTEDAQSKGPGPAQASGRLWVPGR
jgi:hypothetical protein